MKVDRTKKLPGKGVYSRLLDDGGVVGNLLKNQDVPKRYKGRSCSLYRKNRSALKQKELGEVSNAF